jgi:hypothetical protein
MYEDSLLAMEYFLKEVEENHWLQWIQKDLDEWDSKRSVSHHLSAYGGMGSFNDVVICKANKHSIPDGAESWADPIFNWLKSLCFFLAKNPEKEYSLPELKEQIGYHDASLSAFVGGENTSNELRGLFESKQPIQGWRCLECGYGEVSNSDINYYIAQTIVPTQLLEACVSNQLIPAIKDLLSINIKGLEGVISNVNHAIKKAGVSVNNREGWMRPCPSCNSEDTVVYRWYYSDGGFVAGEDNLTVKNNKKWWQLW